MLILIAVGLQIRPSGYNSFVHKELSSPHPYPSPKMGGELLRQITGKK